VSLRAREKTERHKFLERKRARRPDVLRKEQRLSSIQID
jgi:hypothetical protein